jgi:hypothetical protein
MVVWMVNTLIFTSFRVPLHTVFVVLPGIRSLALKATAVYWIAASNNDPQMHTYFVVICALKFVFYTLTLANTSLASAGFCIYREVFSAEEILTRIGYSMALSVSVLSVQFVSDIQQTFLFLGVFAIGMVAYVKDVVISVIILTNLIKEMQGHPQVIAKLRLARYFAVTSWLIITGTVLSSVICIFKDVDHWIYAIVSEMGVFANTVLQAKCFLLRRSYCGQTVARTNSPRKKVIKLISPVESIHCVLTEMSTVLD